MASTIGGRRPVRAMLAVALTFAAVTAAVPTTQSAASESRCVPSTVAEGGVAAVTDDRYHNPATGVIRAVMIFVDFADAPAGDQDTGDYADVLLPGGTDWIEAASYGRAQMEVTTVDRWFRMAFDQDAYEWHRDASFRSFWRYVHDAVEAADPHVDFSPYDIVYIVPVDGADNIDFSPAYVGRESLPVEADGRPIDLAVPFGQDIHSEGPKLLVHETGHLFGLPDLYADGHVFDRHPYVGGFDIMGGSGNAPDHFAWHKLLLGWIDQADVVCLDTDGTQEVRLRPLSSSSGTRMVGLPIGDSRLYALEYRDGTGVDAPFGLRYEEGPCSTGVVAYLVDQDVPTFEGPIRVLDPYGDDWAYGCHPIDEAAITPASGSVGAGDDHVVEVVSLDAEEAVVRVRRSPGAGLAVAPPPQELEGREMHDDPWAEAADTTVRVGTDDPIETALAISRLRFDDHGARYVVLSRDDAYPDALAATGLLSQATLLFNPTDRLRDDVAVEIDRVLEEIQLSRVYLLGGTAALSQQVEDTLVDAGYRVERLWGTSRIGTAVAVRKEIDRVFGNDWRTILVARARGTQANPTAGWADSVTGGGIAAAAQHPILLSESSGLPEATRFRLRYWTGRAVLLGGVAALDANVAAQVRSVVEPIHRVAGVARDATATTIMTNLWHRDGGSGRFVVVNGYDDLGWAFGLAAAGLSADGLAPILLVDRDDIPPATREALSSCGAKQVETIVIGGPSFVSDATLDAIEALDGQAC